MNQPAAMYLLYTPPVWHGHQDMGRHFDRRPVTFAVGTRVTSPPAQIRTGPIRAYGLYRAFCVKVVHTNFSDLVCSFFCSTHAASMLPPRPPIGIAVARIEVNDGASRRRRRLVLDLPGPCFANSHSPRLLPIPPSPQPVARLCSSASRLLWRDQTSSATAPGLPDTAQCSTHADTLQP